MSDPYASEPAPIREDTTTLSPTTVEDCKADYQQGAADRAAFDRHCQQQ